VFVNGKPFQLNVVFAGKVGGYPSEALSGALLLSRLLSLSTNIKLGKLARDKTR
jgi:hypothetical protein